MAAQEIDPHDFFTHQIDPHFEFLVNEIVLSTNNNLGDQTAWNNVNNDPQLRSILRAKSFGRKEYIKLRRQHAIYHARREAGDMNMETYANEIDELTSTFADPNA